MNNNENEYKKENKYYSVLIHTRNNATISNPNKTIIEIDKTKKEIVGSIIIPYLYFKTFNVDGYILIKSDIDMLKVVETKMSIKEIVDYSYYNDNDGFEVICEENIINSPKYSINITQDILDEVSHSKEKSENTLNNSIMLDKTIFDISKVFIVHGHDNELKQEVARYVEKLGFDAVILHEQASEGKTIIEKIEKYSDVGYAIVLYTECDKGYDKNKPNEIKNRASQNVVFEHGYLIAKLGRERVCALVKGDVEKPGDISGVLYVSYDEKGAWKNEVAKEMKTVGYNVDLNNIL